MKKIGLLITYAIYFLVLVGIVCAFLAPKLARAVEIPIKEQIKFGYELNDKVPEFVIDEIISRYATGTLAYQVKRTLYCESRFYNVQSNVIKNGKQEDSWGISQIHLPSNKISREQALDIEFAIKWTIEHFDGTVWYGYNREKDKCNN